MHHFLPLFPTFSNFFPILHIKRSYVYYLTNFNTFSRWLLRIVCKLPLLARATIGYLVCCIQSYGQFSTLTLYSDPNQNHNSNPNEKFDLLPYIAMSSDQSSFLPINFQGSILTLHHVG